MKIYKCFICCLSFLCVLLLSGCGNKTIDYSFLYNDDILTNNNLTFVYDNENHTAFIGGENETIHYYKKDISKGWDKDGYRIGIRLSYPTAIKDISSLKIKCLDNEYDYKDCAKNVNFNVSKEVNFYPLLKDKIYNFDIEINWGKGYKKQKYKVVINSETAFEDMQNVELNMNI